jgi:hypothetical protein
MREVRALGGGNVLLARSRAPLSRRTRAGPKRSIASATRAEAGERLLRDRLSAVGV